MIEQARRVLQEAQKVVVDHWCDSRPDSGVQAQAANDAVEILECPVQDAALHRFAELAAVAARKLFRQAALSRLPG